MGYREFTDAICRHISKDVENWGMTIFVLKRITAFCNSDPRFYTRYNYVPTGPYSAYKAKLQIQGMSKVPQKWVKECQIEVLQVGKKLLNRRAKYQRTWGLQLPRLLNVRGSLLLHAPYRKMCIKSAMGVAREGPLPSCIHYFIASHIQYHAKLRWFFLNYFTMIPIFQGFCKIQLIHKIEKRVVSFIIDIWNCFLSYST